MRRPILIIRLGALGDFFLSFPAFAALRAHHANDEITLLTTPPFVTLARESRWFDAVRADTRPAWHDIPNLLRLQGQLRGYDFTYDLQTSRRSSRYYRLAGRPPWSGIARGCSHPDADPNRNRKHTVQRQQDQLAAAGVPPAGAPDLGWLAQHGPRIPGPYALLVPATSGSHGGAKTWPLHRYAQIAAWLEGQGVLPVILGTAAEAPMAHAIQARAPRALDLTGQTSLLDLAGLATRASLAIGGDTGPIHAAAIMGCRCIALFSKYSDITQAGPVGSTVLQSKQIDSITVDQVTTQIVSLEGVMHSGPVPRRA